jgi:hypothetical protein
LSACASWAFPGTYNVHVGEDETMVTERETTTREQELAEYLQERIKPGLNRGAIPLLARSIARELVRQEQADADSDEHERDEEPEDEHRDEPRAEADDEREDEPDDDELDDEADEEPEDEPRADADDEREDEPDDDELDDEADEGPEDETDEEPESPIDEFEAEMRELQAELGEEWILRFSVQGDEAWLTAEKQDGSQHVEGPTAEVLLEAVDLLDEGGGRSG